METGFSFRIWDNGLGIEKEALSQVFTPFYTTKTPGGGNLGLGLSVCYQVINQGHGGHIEIKSEKDHWTDIRVDDSR